MKIERQPVINAINELGRSVTAGDVSAKTGLPLHVAQLSLNRVASETYATLEVSTNGTIVYKFSPLFQNAYASRAALAMLKRVAAIVLDAAFWILRASFGIALIASLVSIVVLLFIALTASSKGNSNSGSTGGSWNLGINAGDLANFFMWSSRPIYIGAATSGDSYDDYLHGHFASKETTAPSSPSFLMCCYSFLFGDGNPNDRFEQEKWRLIAEHIRANNGTTTSEQLAPLTGAKPTDENAVLPVLVRFEGNPMVTEAGNIIYQFPSLAKTTVAPHTVAVADCALERDWEFSGCDIFDLGLVAALGAVNLLGGALLVHLELSTKALHPYHLLIQCIFVYGCAFMLVPALRFVGIHLMNAIIDARNEIRKKNLEFLKNADANLNRKLLEARANQLRTAVHDAASIVYTTDKDLLEQEY